MKIGDLIVVKGSDEYPEISRKLIGKVGKIFKETNSVYFDFMVNLNEATYFHREELMLIKTNEREVFYE